MWRAGIVVVLLGLTVGLIPSDCCGEEEGRTRWGLSLTGGPNADFIHGRPTLTLISLLPRVGFPLHPNWDIEVEGNLSYYGIKHEKNLYLLGTQTNLCFKPFQGNGWKWFFIVGLGAGYHNAHDDYKYLGKSHVAGILHGGTGLEIKVGKGYFFRGEYRLQHISDPFHHDEGINTHCFLIGLSF